jgi:hypothetical protein
LSPERVIVPSLEAVSPVPAVGVTLASRGGHAVAHAPVHALMVPESALNRYRVRPLALTRIDPRLLFATRTVAVLVVAVVVLVAGGAAVAAAPPPQAATARAMTGIKAALARKVMGLLRVMSVLRLGSIDSRSRRRCSNHATRSPRPGDLVVARCRLDRNGAVWSLPHGF